jgi:enoyl-CoA hydratase/carnithine racemase
VLSAEPIDAQRALDYGILTAVVPRADLDAAADALARRLIAAPEAALQSTRRALRDGANLPLQDALRLERRLATRAAATGT